MADSATVVYLAAPLSHPDRAVRYARTVLASRAAGWLMGQGYTVFSPLSHGGMVIRYCALPTDWEFWSRQCLSMVERCDALLILGIDGWHDSVGVGAEIEHARRLGKPIGMVWPEGDGWAMDAREEWR